MHTHKWNWNWMNERFECQHYYGKGIQCGKTLAIIHPSDIEKYMTVSEYKLYKEAK